MWLMLHPWYRSIFHKHSSKIAVEVSLPTPSPRMQTRPASRDFARLWIRTYITCTWRGMASQTPPWKRYLLICFHGKFHSQRGVDEWGRDRDCCVYLYIIYFQTLIRRLYQFLFLLLWSAIHDKNNLNEIWFIFIYNPRIGSLSWRWCYGSRSLRHIVSTIRMHKVVNVCPQLAYSFLLRQDPKIQGTEQLVSGWVSPFNWLRIASHNHSQRLIFLVFADLIMLTSDINCHSHS